MTASAWAPPGAGWWARYIGLPFQDGGRGPDRVDCWGLVRLVLAEERGIVLPSYGEISAADLVRVARAMDAGKDDGWRVPAVPQAFDVCLMRGPRGGRAVVHVGLMTDTSHMIHVEQATATVRVPVSHFSVAGRIIGFRRRMA